MHNGVHRYLLHLRLVRHGSINLNKDLSLVLPSLRLSPPFPSSLPLSLPPSLPPSSHLSERLQGLRNHRSSSSPPSVSPPGGRDLSPEQQLKARTSFLQGRVQHLQQHNTQLQSCITQLRAVATMVTTVLSAAFMGLKSASTSSYSQLASQAACRRLAHSLPQLI